MRGNGAICSSRRHSHATSHFTWRYSNMNHKMASQKQCGKQKSTHFHSFRRNNSTKHPCTLLYLQLLGWKWVFFIPTLLDFYPCTQVFHQKNFFSAKVVLSPSIMIRFLFCTLFYSHCPPNKPNHEHHFAIIDFSITKF